MRLFSPQSARSISQTFQSTTKLRAARTLSARMSSSTDKGDLNIENTNIKVADYLELSDQQKTWIGSVLDLFAGRPSLAKLQLWKDEAEFVDPLCIAKGREQYEAQWYGLQTAFEEIERLEHEVKDAGNPIIMELKQRYKVKGIGKEQIVQSKVHIYTDGDKISKVEDRWEGRLPESSIAQAFQRLNAMTMPKVVGVPKSAEEDAQRGNQ